MQKLFYLLFDDAQSDGTKLRESICRDAVPAIRRVGGTEIVVFGADEDVAAGSPVRNCDPPIRAMVSFWMEDATDRAPAENALEALVDTPPVGFIVLESRPLVHARTKGARTPGMKQITCITRRPDLDEAEFIRIWHDDHRRVALETQSTFGYVRNEIVRSLTPGMLRGWSAIVEESFPIEALADPHVFFAASSAEEYQANLSRMIESCRRFMRLDALDVTFVSEYYMG
jgi:hypothetical protein